MAARFITHRFREVHPFEVQAVLLNACNLRCVYCLCPDVKTALMTTEQWRDIIRRLGALGTIRIKFQGGEPTMRQDFRQLCAEAKRAGIVTAVTTNGLPVFERPELLDYLDEVIFSFDSVSPEINDRLRGRGSHEKVVKAMGLALGRGLKTYVNMVVTTETLGGLEAMLEFCEARGARLHAQPVNLDWQFGDKEAGHLALSQEQVREMHVRMAQWKRKGRGLMFCANTYQRTAGWPDYGVTATRSVGDSPCMAGKDYIDIQPNGDVHPCGVHKANFTPKNIIRDGLTEALRNARRHDCADCWIVYLNERKAVFSLKPRALLEILRRG
jgi:MoaA/NifB/PqqE/SkfB family radical SAM enzyme